MRQHLNLTQVKLAEELGTRQQTISEWENGMYRPRGASATLLSIVAERSGFTYKAGKSTMNQIKFSCCGSFPEEICEHALRFKQISNFFTP